MVSILPGIGLEDVVKKASNRRQQFLYKVKTAEQMNRNTQFRAFYIHSYSLSFIRPMISHLPQCSGAALRRPCDLLRPPVHRLPLVWNFGLSQRYGMTFGPRDMLLTVIALADRGDDAAGVVLEPAETPRPRCWPAGFGRGRGDCWSIVSL